MYIHKGANSYYLIVVTIVGCSHMTLGIAVSVTAVSSVVSVMLRMMGMSESLHYSIETAVRSSLVFDYSDCAISLLEGIRSLNVVPVPVLVLFFDITSVRVVDFVFEFVLCWSLKKQ